MWTIGRFSLSLIGRGPPWPKNAVIAGINLPRRLTFQVAQRILKNGHTTCAVRDLEPEGRLARLETVSEVLQ